jgi:hypothetical protein
VVAQELEGALQQRKKIRESLSRSGLIRNNNILYSVYIVKAKRLNARRPLYTKIPERTERDVAGAYIRKRPLRIKCTPIMCYSRPIYSMFNLWIFWGRRANNGSKVSDKRRVAKRL